jgi:sugar O-acyltransferase (sialic acid O-acetyltransferase NeuD family)
MNKALKPGVVIIGLNTVTKTVIDILELINKYHITGIIHVNETTNLRTFETKYPVFNSLDDLPVLEKQGAVTHVIISVMDGHQRKDISERIEKSSPCLTFINVVHPTAVLAKHSVLGKGVIIGARAVLNSHCLLGDFCIVQDKVSIGHDCHIGSFVTIKTNVTMGGQVVVGTCSSIQSGANIINNMVLGTNCFIKENTLVLKNIPEDAIADVIPAKIIKRE